MAHSLVVVPVPEVDALVRRRLATVSPGHVPRAPDDPVAHITLLAPFVERAGLTDGVLAELRWFFADVTPFGFGLTHVARFPGGTVYLAPDPAAPFRHLAQALARRFPEHPPYGGAFDDVVPHLTLPLLPGERTEDVERELDVRLPVAAHAREAALLWWEDGDTRTLETFPFGTSAA